MQFCLVIVVDGDLDSENDEKQEGKSLAHVVSISHSLTVDGQRCQRGHHDHCSQDHLLEEACGREQGMQEVELNVDEELLLAGPTVGQNDVVSIYRKHREAEHDQGDRLQHLYPPKLLKRKPQEGR